jgi:hypothetical protein
MTTAKEQSYFYFQDSIAFLHILDINDIFQHKNTIDAQIAKDEIVVLAIIYNGQDLSPVDQNLNFELYQWLNSLPILSMIAVDNYGAGDLVELMMCCDIRLGGNNLTVKFPDDVTGLAFDFDERCQLLMGKERNSGGYKNLLGTVLHANELTIRRFVNQLIDFNAVVNEIRNYKTKIIGNKANGHIQTIMKCFNSYKHFGINTNRELLLEEEPRQFCELIVKEYLKNGTSNEDRIN